MKRHQVIAAATAVLALLAPAVLGAPGATASSDVAPGPASVAAPAAAADVLLVGYAPGASPQERARARDRAGARFEEQVVAGDGRHAEVELVRLPPASNRDDAIARIERDPAVRYAEPDWKVEKVAASNDPLYTGGLLWGAYGDATTPANAFGSQAGEAWAAGSIGSDAVYVGVIDEGIDFNHPDLADNIWTNAGDPVDGIDGDLNGYRDDIHGWDFYNGDNSVYDPADGDHHGTHVAGTIGARGGNGIGSAGVAWDVTMISAKFLGPDGGYTSDAVRALNYLRNLKTRLLNPLNIVATSNSWGGGWYSQTLHDAIIRAAKAEMLFIAAAGNSNSDNDAQPAYPTSYDTTVGTSTESPASYDAVISVAALDSDGTLAWFSNYGSTSVDLGAPGVSIYSTLPNGNYGAGSGTSMAAPHVTGGVVLYKATHAAATAADIRRGIFDAVVPTADLAGRTATGGRLDVSRFRLGDTTPPGAPTGLTATPGDASVALDWDDNPEVDVAGYHVYRSSGTATAKRIATVGPDSAHTDTTVSNGTTYTYSVTAVDASGNESAPSATVSATPVATAPTITLTATGYRVRGWHRVDLAWSGATTADVDVWRDGVLVQRTANDGAHTDDPRSKGKGATYTYRLCEAASTSNCSEDRTVTF